MAACSDRDKLLKQKISEVTGTSVEEIQAQSSRELSEIARALDIHIGDEESSPKPPQADQGVSQEKETYASALMRQSSSIVNGGLSIVKSLVNGTDEKPQGMADQKKIEDAAQEESNIEVKKAKERVQVLKSALRYSDGTPDGGEKTRRSLGEAEAHLEALLVGTTPKKGNRAESNTTLEEVSPPSSVISQATLIINAFPNAPLPKSSISKCSKAISSLVETPITKHFASSIPYASLTRSSHGDTLLLAASLPVMMNVKRVKKKGEVCARSDLEKLLKEVEMVKKRGVSVAGGQDVKVEWVSLSSGFPRKENTSTRLRNGRSTKHASSYDENIKQKVSKWSQFVKKEVQNPIVTVKWGEVEGRNCSGVDGNMMSLSPGPSDSNLYSQPQISSKETMQPRFEVRPAPSRNLGGTQTTLVVQNNPNKENRQDSEDYWAFTPTAAGNKLREDLQKEEEQKEKMKEVKRGKKTKQTTKALEAFLKTTESRVQERTLRSDSNCPFCNRCIPAISLQAHANQCPADNKAAP